MGERKRRHEKMDDEWKELNKEERKQEEERKEVEYE